MRVEPDGSQQPLQSFWQALQRSAGAVSCSLQYSLAQNAGSAFAPLQLRRPVLSRGGLPFASTSSSHDPSQPASTTKKRKKSKRSKPAEMTFSAAQECAEDASPTGTGSSSQDSAPATPSPTASPSAAKEEKASMPAQPKQPKNKQAKAKAPLTPRQLSRLWMKMYGGVEAEVKDRVISLKRLAKRARKQRAFKEVGGDIPGIRKESRWDIMQNIPGWKLRPAAPKMQLRPHEHFALALDLWGKGLVFSPERFLGHWRGGLHDFSWGIFGRNEEAQRVLSGKYAGRNPEVVLTSQEFYDDLIKNASQMELTAMLVAERDLPLAETRDAFLERQGLVLRQIPDDPAHIKPALKPKHAALLEELRRTFTEEKLKPSGLLDRKGRIRENSKLILTVTPDYHITAEAITPGTLKEQQPVFLGHCKDRRFARACMEQFLGRFPLDLRGKAAVGNGALYVTNGFNFMPPEISGNPNQFYLADDGESLVYPKPIDSLIPAQPEDFHISQGAAPLLNGISRRQISPA